MSQIIKNLSGGGTLPPNVPTSFVANSGTAIPAANILDVPGNNTANNGFATWTTGSGNTLQINSYGTAKWVVNPIAGVGTHQTISAAIASASSGDDIFITEGTYTENPVMKAGVNLVAWGSDPFDPTVVISGTVTASYTGNASITGIDLTTNGAAAISITGTNVLALNLIDCAITALNANAITSSNPNAALFLLNNTSSASGSNAIFSITSVGGVTITNCYLGSSSGNNTIASGALNFYNSTLNSFALNTSNAAALNGFNCYFNNPANQTALTLTGTGAGIFENCSFATGSASAISVGVNCILALTNCQITSSNTNAITGAGQVNYANVAFLGTSSTINTSSQILYVSQPGANQVVRPGSYPYTVSAQDRIISVDTSTTANTVNLPASPSQGEEHTVKDRSANAALFNITVSGNGHNIIGTTSAASQVISLNGAAVTYVYDTNVWLSI
jgi:hypothetical protein